MKLGPTGLWLIIAASSPRSSIELHLQQCEVLEAASNSPN